MIRVGVSFPPTRGSPLMVQKPTRYGDDDDDTASVTSCESDSSTIRAMKSTVRQFDDICRSLDIDIERLIKHDDDANASEDEAANDITLEDDLQKLPERSSTQTVQADDTSPVLIGSSLVQPEGKQEDPRLSRPRCWGLVERQYYTWMPRWWERPNEMQSQFLFQGHKQWWRLPDEEPETQALLECRRSWWQHPREQDIHYMFVGM